MTNGVSNGIIFLDDVGHSWSGIVSTTVEFVKSDAKSLYFDGRKTFTKTQALFAKCFVSAFTYPEALDFWIGTPGVTPGTNHRRVGFSFVSGTRLYIFSDVTLTLVSSPNETTSETQDPQNFEFRLESLSEGYVIFIDTDLAHADALEELEQVIYGTELIDPVLPSLGELRDIFEQYATLVITDNGDGTWTADGPDSIIQMLDATTFQIDSPGANFLDSDSYTLSSW